MDRPMTQIEREGDLKIDVPVLTHSSKGLYTMGFENKV